jgi:hypothetical protein
MWAGGVPLRNSIYAFSNPDKAAAYKATDHTKQIATVFQAITDAVSSSEAGNSKLAAIQVEAAQTSDLRQELEAEVIAQLRSGDLIGIGFDTPRRSDELPKQVPADIWNIASVKWARDEVQGSGLHMSAVRITRPKQAQWKEPGRPGTQTLVEAAFVQLIAEGKIDLQRSIKSHFEVVRERIWRNNPGMNRSTTGLGDKALSKHLGPLFRKAKSRK